MVALTDYSFDLYAAKYTTGVDFTSAIAPDHDYDITTETLGLRWNGGNDWLGRYRVNYEQRKTRTDDISAERDEVSEELRVDGKKEFGEAGSGSYSNISYGYRYDDDQDQVSDSGYEQHYAYLYDTTALGENANLNINLSAYDRSSTWNTGSTVGDYESQFYSLNTSLRFNPVERFSHGYTLSAALNDTEDGETQSYSGGANLGYQISDQWTTSASASASSTSNSRGGGSTSNTANIGTRFSDTFDSYRVFAGYALDVRNSYYEDTGDFDTIGNTITVGYSKMGRPVFSDSLNYRFSNRVGDEDALEHNLRYTVNSRLTELDNLYGTFEYRDFDQESLTSDFDIASARLDFNWSRRIVSVGTMTSSLGYTRTDNRDYINDDYYAQLRMVVQPYFFRNLRTIGLLRYEDRKGNESRPDLEKIRAEFDVRYALGKWVVTGQYKYRQETSTLKYTDNSYFISLMRQFNLY